MPATKNRQFAKVLRQPTTTSAGRLVISTPDKCAEYVFDRPAPEVVTLSEYRGIGVRMPVYVVYVTEGQSKCDCKGFRFHGHCKHVKAMKALVGAGRI